MRDSPYSNRGKVGGSIPTRPAHRRPDPWLPEKPFCLRKRVSLVLKQRENWREEVFQTVALADDLTLGFEGDGFACLVSDGRLGLEDAVSPLPFNEHSVDEEKLTMAVGLGGRMRVARKKAWVEGD